MITVPKADIVLPSYDRAENAKYLSMEIASMFHPKAWEEELQGDPKTIESIQLWLRQRFQMADAGKGYTVSLALNPWNELNGIGLQSVSVAIKSESEWKSPTIGVVTNGMLGNPGKMGEAQFPVEQGRAEEILFCSDDLMMGGGEDDDEIRRHRRDDSILVSGPKAVRTYLEMQNAAPEQVRNVVNHGVYICLFVNISSGQPRGEDFSSALDD